MSFSPILRLTLHLWLIAALVLPTAIAWPQGAAHAPVMAQVTAAAMDDMAGDDMADMPCDEGAAQPPVEHSKQPCDQGCCPYSSCDFSACLATACLPHLPALLAKAPVVPVVIPWNLGSAPRALPERLLRPPIA